MFRLIEVAPELVRVKWSAGVSSAQDRGSRQTRSAVADRTPTGLIRALNVLFPGTGPGGYFKNGSIEATLDEVSKSDALIDKIARTQTRAWIEVEMGSEFGLDRRGLNPSLQIEVKHGRPLPNTSLKWNRVTAGTTSALQIEEATVRYLNARLPKWGNNRVRTMITLQDRRCRGDSRPHSRLYTSIISRGVVRFRLQTRLLQDPLLGRVIPRRGSSWQTEVSSSRE